jgi:hypothetical protein
MFRQRPLSMGIQSSGALILGDLFVPMAYFVLD